ncbi:unnamed protein product [Mytilus edulis]|uniref:Integrase catalytic domain-containing protein n=1 Tax=Mytilus edulis TaxID=6550 RepID=A0A8S3R7F5_MYTED|nr:unnamed protein product [Mytilus edulis]
MKDMCADCTIVHRKPRYPQSQGSVERGNAHIKNMLVIWMRENNSKKWNIWLKFVQFEKNNSHQSGINRSPYKAISDKPNELSSDKQHEPDEVSQLNAALNLSETQETELDVHEFAVCENPCFSNIQCSICAQYIHELCSKGNISDTITCHLCSNKEVIKNERRHASDSMTKQAVGMRHLSERVLTEVDVGANVLVAISPCGSRERRPP